MNMSLLKPLGTGQGYLKAGFLGFAGSGKSVTSALLLCATRRAMKLDGPIVLFDTEGGSEYIAPMIRALTGQDVVGFRGRSFSDLLEVGEECLKIKAAGLSVDSITHVWRELCLSYMKQVNEGLRKRNREPRTRLEFQDWAALKEMWSKWPDFYLNSPLHIAICGRAGYEYDFEENSEGKKELRKTGIKMKVEGEFGFEPSLLVEMERIQEPDGKGGFTQKRRATILKDRFGLIDGAEMMLDSEPLRREDFEAAMEATFALFAPHVARLTPGAHAPVDTTLKTETGADQDGDSSYARERKARTILCEEIQGELVAAYPTQGADDKKAKADLIHRVFATRSWTAVEGLESQVLREGLRALREEIAKRKAPPSESSAPTSDPTTTTPQETFR